MRRWQWESLTEHTEGHVAAIMRQEKIYDVVLYVNKLPCKLPGNLKGCHENIESVMPWGSRLTVWVVNANGGSLLRRYRGTGEATDEPR